MSEAEFFERMRHYVTEVLLNDQIMAVAYDAKIDRDRLLDVIQPMVTNTVPFRAQQQLHALLPEQRKAVRVLNGLIQELTHLEVWQSGEIRNAVSRVAKAHDIELRVARQVCESLMSFGPSPLDPFLCIEVVGLRRACRRCEIALESLRQNHMIG